MSQGKARPICYVCSSKKHVDSHHYDCCEGKLSPETAPLCRRCHRTYHGLGVEWFEDEYLDKAIEIENKRREIVNSQSQCVNPFSLLTRAHIKRSDYWYKKHGIKPEHPLQPKKGKAFPSFQLPHGEPLCGQDWVEEHMYDLLDWVPRIEIISPDMHLEMDIDNTKKLKDAVKILRSLKSKRGVASL